MQCNHVAGVNFMWGSGRELMMGPDDFCPIELIPIPNIPLISHLPFTIHSLPLIHGPGLPHNDLSVPFMMEGAGGGSNADVNFF